MMHQEQRNLNTQDTQLTKIKRLRAKFDWVGLKVYQHFRWYSKENGKSKVKILLDEVERSLEIFKRELEVILDTKLKIK